MRLEFDDWKECTGSWLDPNDETGGGDEGPAAGEDQSSFTQTASSMSTFTQRTSRRQSKIRKRRHSAEEQEGGEQTMEAHRCGNPTEAQVTSKKYRRGDDGPSEYEAGRMTREDEDKPEHKLHGGVKMAFVVGYDDESGYLLPVITGSPKWEHFPYAVRDTKNNAYDGTIPADKSYFKELMNENFAKHHKRNWNWFMYFYVVPITLLTISCSICCCCCCCRICSPSKQASKFPEPLKRDSVAPAAADPRIEQLMKLEAQREAREAEERKERQEAAERLERLEAERLALERERKEQAQLQLQQPLGQPDVNVNIDWSTFKGTKGDDWWNQDGGKGGEWGKGDPGQWGGQEGQWGRDGAWGQDGEWGQEWDGVWGQEAKGDDQQWWGKGGEGDWGKGNWDPNIHIHLPEQQQQVQPQGEPIGPGGRKKADRSKLCFHPAMENWMMTRVLGNGVSLPNPLRRR
ncbi:unnamed protein product [Amoebophrya sp. A25]|nr:unnamed protein product [Amoebophrya sp. A25]|eukprot:GSA25T00012896001.1